MFIKEDLDFFVSLSILSIVPILYLFNKNITLFKLTHVIALGVIIMISTGIMFMIMKAIYKSSWISTVGGLFFIVLIYGMNGFAKQYGFYNNSSIYLISVIPPVVYVLTYTVYKLVHRKLENFRLEYLPRLILYFSIIMLVLNVLPISVKYLSYLRDKDNLRDSFKHKTNYVINPNSSSPNIYFILCDGMLGFYSFEKYFNDSQAGLLQDLELRGFRINKDAKLEVGHATTIAIPALMSPSFHDIYLSEHIENHNDAMKLRHQSDSGLYLARLNNETINAFKSKNYLTITVSVDGKYLPPITDYYYYIDAFYRTKDDFFSEPKLVKINGNTTVEEMDRIYAHQLGEAVLAGLPGILFDYVFYDSNEQEIPVAYDKEKLIEVLGDHGSEGINSSLIISIEDLLNRSFGNQSKFVLVHNLMAHRPFYLDEDGKILHTNEEDYNYIFNYPNHHKYSTKVLVNIIDRIIEVDPNAVIVLQADHGLHMQSRNQILRAFNNEEAVLDIWNNVLSSIRIPEMYFNGWEDKVLNNPKNISRYLVNSFVGDNYEYLEDVK